MKGAGTAKTMATAWLFLQWCIKKDVDLTVEMRDYNKREK